MNPTDPREEALFEAAAELPADRREAYLNRVCGSDSALRQRILARLEAPAVAATPAAVPPPAAAPPANKTMVIALPPEEQAGDRIGRYKLLQNIGEGGCGIVYMAEQEEPVRRRVALKVIKLGMDTKQVVARFDAERQALAMMDHPNIAKVLDAGATEAGRPFFVMELVRGIKITAYCDQNKLSTRERIELFIQVCHAIQHAHQKGVIHRDIKPSNILVTLHDGVPIPKVIDFGIAKATQGRLTDDTLFTAFEQFIGTPAYMSPEQAEMSGLDVDTRSDIYSLGVLLYELLTGKTPFDSKDLIQSGLDAMRRTIREKEPERPSTRISTMLDGELSATANQRRVEAPRLIALLRGDPDWIAMKCLEKDRTRRYETASALAADLTRYLNNEPVEARPPSSLYRFQKMVRRNKLGFVAGGAVAAALIIGLGLSTYLFVQERKARKRADEAERWQASLRQKAEEMVVKEAQFRKQAEMGEKISRSGLYLTQGAYEKAEQLVNEVPPIPVMASLFNALGSIHLQRTEFPAAVSNLTKVVDLAPDDHWAYHTLAPILVQVGDLDGYRHLCQRMLSQYGSTTNLVIAERLLKDCLLVASPDLNREAVAKFGPANARLPTLYAVFSAAFGAYRLDHFAEAIEGMNKVLVKPNVDVTRDVEAYMVLALAYQKLNQPDAARAALAKGNEVMQKNLPKPGATRLGDNPSDVLIDWALAREATEALGAGTKPN